jgi:hypothetical protein
MKITPKKYDPTDAYLKYAFSFSKSNGKLANFATKENQGEAVIRKSIKSIIKVKR